MNTEVHAGCSLFRTLLMEDLIIYGVGALAVRGARRMLFGPSKEDRLAEQVGTSSCVSLGVPLGLCMVFRTCWSHHRTFYI